MKTQNTFSSFSVNNLGGAAKFYAETLGLRITIEDDILHLHVAEGYEVLLYEKDDHEPATFTVLNFEVDDIEVAVDELTQKGVTFEQYDGEIETDEKGIHRDDMATIAWFKDPSGNILSIMQSTQ